MAFQSTQMILILTIWMGSALPKDLLANICGHMSVQYRRTLTIVLPTQLAKYVHVKQPAQCKYHPLLAVTTTVSLDVQGTFNMAPSTPMMFSGTDSNVGFLRLTAVTFPTSRGSTRSLTQKQVMSLRLGCALTRISLMKIFLYHRMTYTSNNSMQSFKASQ